MVYVTPTVAEIVLTTAVKSPSILLAWYRDRSAGTGPNPADVEVSFSAVVKTSQNVSCDGFCLDYFHQVRSAVVAIDNHQDAWHALSQRRKCVLNR